MLESRWRLIERWIMDYREQGDVVVVTTDERLDALVAPQLKDAVRRIVEEEHKHKILVDLGNTRFIDSSGCGALVASLRVVIRANGELKLARPSAQARSLFELTRLHRVFEIYDDVDAALESFR